MASAQNTGVIQGLGEWLGSRLGPLLDFIIVENVGTGLAMIVFIMGAGIVLLTIAWGCREFFILWRALRVLRPVNGEDYFAENYGRIDQGLSRIGVVKKAWGEFSESLLDMEGHGSKKPKKYNTVRPHHFLNIQDMHLGPRMLGVFPHIFVGFGLLLTFLGLISALSQSTEIMSEAGDAQGAKEAIGGLLNAASAKFYASLSALAVSIVLTVLLRLYATGISISVRTLNERIERGVKYLSQEQQLMETNKLVREQLDQFKQFNNDLAMKVGNKINEVLEPLVETLNRAGTDIGNEVGTKIEEALKPLVETLNRAGKDMGEQNAKVTDEIATMLSASMGDLTQRLEGVSKNLEGFSKTIENALGGFDRELSEAMRGLSASMRELIAKMSNEIGETLDEVTRQIKDLMSGMRDTMGDIDQTLRENAEKEGRMATQGMKEASERFKNTMRFAASTISGQFKESVQSLLESMDALSGKMASLDQSLTDIPNKLSSVNEVLGESAKSMTQTQGAMSEAQDALSETARSIRQTIESATALARQHADMASNASESTQAAMDGINGAVPALRETVNNFSDRIAARLDKLDGAEKDLSDYLLSINESTKEVVTRLSNYAVKMDESLVKVMSNMSIIVEELQEIVNITHGDKEGALHVQSS